MNFVVLFVGQLLQKQANNRHDLWPFNTIAMVRPVGVRGMYWGGDAFSVSCIGSFCSVCDNYIPYFSIWLRRFYCSYGQCTNGFQPFFVYGTLYLLKRSPRELYWVREWAGGWNSSLLVNYLLFLGWQSHHIFLSKFWCYLASIWIHFWWSKKIEGETVIEFLTVTKVRMN